MLEADVPNSCDDLPGPEDEVVDDGYHDEAQQRRSRDAEDDGPREAREDGVERDDDVPEEGRARREEDRPHPDRAGLNGRMKP